MSFEWSPSIIQSLKQYIYIYIYIYVCPLRVSRLGSVREDRILVAEQNRSMNSEQKAMTVNRNRSFIPNNTIESNPVKSIIHTGTILTMHTLRMKNMIGNFRLEANYSPNNHPVEIHILSSWIGREHPYADTANVLTNICGFGKFDSTTLKLLELESRSAS